MKFKVIRSRVAVLPKEFISEEYMVKVAEIARKGILENIKTSTRGDGQGAIRTNAKSTRIAKNRSPRTIRLGGTIRPLIDKDGRFIQGGKGSWTYKLTKKAITIFPATPELRRLARWVQKIGFVGWFHLSKKTMAEIKRLTTKEVRRVLRRSATTRGPG